MIQMLSCLVTEGESKVKKKKQLNDKKIVEASQQIVRSWGVSCLGRTFVLMVLERTVFYSCI